MSNPGHRTPEQRAAAKALWTPEKRAQHSVLLRGKWAHERYKWMHKQRAAYCGPRIDPQCGLGYLDRGVYRTFELSWKLARRHLPLKIRITKMSTWKLKRTKQCAKCPWKVSTNPYDIPNGYCKKKHADLINTIAEPGSINGVSGSMRAMACHESNAVGNESHCIGWLVNQIGPGNNIPLRIHMMSCENGSAIQLDGEQHETFEDTLPA